MNIKRMRELAEAKISSIMKDHLVMLAKGKQPGSDSTETMMRLTAMNLVTYEDREYTLTPEGAKLAQEVIGNKQKTQQVKNHNARNRHATMKSLGLTRTRSGAYESQDEKIPELDALLAELTAEELMVLNELSEDEVFNLFVETGILEEGGCPPGQKMVFGRCAKVSKAGLKARVAASEKTPRKNDRVSIDSKERRATRLQAIKDLVRVRRQDGSQLFPPSRKERAMLDRDQARKDRTRGGVETPKKKSRVVKLTMTQKRAQKRSKLRRRMGLEDVERSLRPFVETLRDLLNLDEAGCPPGQIMVFGKCQEPRSASSANDQDKDFDCPSGQRRVGGRCLPAKEADAQDAENKAKHAASRERLKQIDAKDKRAKELAARVKAAGFTPH